MALVITLYVFAGGVTVVLLKRADPTRALLVLAFWPFFLPLALGASMRPSTTEVEGRLLSALAELGAAGQLVLAPEVQRMRSAVDALGGTRHRLAEIDRLLAEPAFNADRAQARLTELATRCAPDDPRLASVRGRLEEIDHLRGLRDQTLADLEFAELKMEELCAKVQRMQLSKLSRMGAGAEPADGALELLREVAGAVEAVNEALAAA